MKKKITYLIIVAFMVGMMTSCKWPDKVSMKYIKERFERNKPFGGTDELLTLNN